LDNQNLTSTPDNLCHFFDRQISLSADRCLVKSSYRINTPCQTFQLKKPSVNWYTEATGKAGLYTTLIIISLASGNTRGETSQPDSLLSALDVNGKFRLADLDVQSLQALLNELNPDCVPGGPVSCTWTVLSLTHGKPDTVAKIDSPQLTNQLPAAKPEQKKRFSNDIPPGFEQFAALESEAVDLYYRGSKLLTVSLIIESKQYSFSDPLLVANELSRLGIAEREELEYFLSEEFPVTEGAICVLAFEPRNCSTQQPIELALLPMFDKKRIDLLVGGKVSKQEQSASSLLPPSSAAAGARAGIRATYASIGGTENTFDVHADGSLSYGNGGLFAQQNFSNQNDDNRIGSLYFGHQFAQHQVKVGTFDFESSEFLLSNEMIGLDWSTSFNRYTNIRDLYSTPLFVSLAGASVVQILVNDNLLSSQSLPSGNHQLNTQNLPNGTYEVEIRIQDAITGLQTERQIFSKRLTLPPPDKLVYGVSIGQLRERDSGSLRTLDGTFAAGSLSKRLTPTIGVDIELTTFSGEQTAQARISRVGSQYEVSVGGIVGSQSMLGKSLRAAYVVNGFRAAVQATHFTSEHDLLNDQSVGRIVQNDFFSRSLGVGYSLGEYQFAMQAEKVTQDADNEKIDRNRYSARLRRKLSFGSAGSAVSAAYLSTDASNEIRIKFDLALDSPDMKQKASIEFVKPENSETRPVLGYQATYSPDHDIGPLADTDTTLGFRTRISEQSTLVGGDLRLAHQFYDLGLGIDLFNDESSEDIQQRTIASVSTQVAASKRRIAVGRNTGPDAGIIIDVEGHPQGSVFDIKVNGSQRGVGRVGSKLFLPLQPFRQHRIDLLPRSTVLGDFEKSSRLVTLYPGNIAVLEIQVQERYVLITRISDAEGQIISDNIIRYQGQPYFINSDGVVQMEVVSGDTLDIDLGEESNCSIKVPDPLGREIVVTPAPLVCL